ncbi:MAG: hypothetical protein HY298_26240 [Verrucomicrobia bacterium]|nr:hypothetical protein [Verrucomicrobiota bacterium]
MNAKYRKVTAQFAPETRFEVIPVPAAPFRGTVETALDRLKDTLLLRLLNETPEPELNALLRRAANEAAALAWLTPFPLLLFPELFEEKAGTARQQAAKQVRVRQRSRVLLAEAA